METYGIEINYIMLSIHTILNRINSLLVLVFFLKFINNKKNNTTRRILYIARLMVFNVFDLSQHFSYKLTVFKPKMRCLKCHVRNHCTTPVEDQDILFCLIFIQGLHVFPLCPADSPLGDGALTESVFACFIGHVHLPKENQRSLSPVQVSESSLSLYELPIPLKNRSELFFLKPEQHSAQAGSPHFLAHYLFLPIPVLQQLKGSPALVAVHVCTSKIKPE